MIGLMSDAWAMSMSEGTGRTNFNLVALNFTAALAGAAFLTTFFPFEDVAAITFFATTFFAVAFTVFLAGFALVAIESPY